MKNNIRYIGILSVLVAGLLLVGCGAANITNPAPNVGEPNSMNDDAPVNDEIPANQSPIGVGDAPDEPVGELPDDQMSEGPIINLPGAVPFQDQSRGPGQADLVEGNAFVNSADLLTMESFPVQISLSLEGNLPTPCNQLTIDIAEPNADNQIHVKVYSLIDPAMSCIAMIEPFSTQVSLPVEDLADGTYEVWVNGTLVGEFSYPG